MHRRSFLAILVGGLTTAASGAALAARTGSEEALAAAVDLSALDETEAEFAHMPPGPRHRGHREWHRRRWARRRRRRMRRRWHRGRWHYYW
jgi:hypothetical protein